MVRRYIIFICVFLIILGARIFGVSTYSSCVEPVAMNVHLNAGKRGETTEVYLCNLPSPVLSNKALFLKLLPKYQESVSHKHSAPFFSIPQLLSSHPPTYSVRLSEIAVSTLRK